MRFDKDTFHWKLVENRAARTAEERYRADPARADREQTCKEEPFRLAGHGIRTHRVGEGVYGVEHQFTVVIPTDAQPVRRFTSI